MRLSGASTRTINEITVAAVLTACAYWFVLVSLFRQWVDDPNYTHGLFVLPMALVLAWRRRARFAAIPPSTWAPGLLITAFGGALYLIGILAAELFTQRVSLVVTVVGLVAATQGRARARVMLFPMLFLLLAVPLPYIIYYKLTFPLQLKSSQLTAGLLSAAGMPVVRMGNVIHLEHYSLEVVTACSGLRSMMTLGTMAVFMTDFMHMWRVGTCVFIAAVIPVAVVANTIRLLMTAVVSAIVSPEAADSFLHELSGIVVFVSGLAILAAVGVVIEWIARKQRA